jgi:flagellar assembly factor FliW
MISGAATAYLDDELMTISSDLLGPIEVDPDELFEFRQGLFGFPQCHSFGLVGAERTGLYWLQSVEHSALTFLLVDPFIYFPDYAVDLSPLDLRELDVSVASEVLILAIVTLPPARTQLPTANLQGPVALNARTRTAKQLVREDNAQGTRCSFDIEKAVPAA